MKFNPLDYTSKHVMHCKTKAEVDDFLNELSKHGLGFEWISAVYRGHWEMCKKKQPDVEMVYIFCTGEISSVGYVSKHDYTILEWSDFMEKNFTRDDLKVGMVVELRRYGMAMVCETSGGELCLSGPDMWFPVSFLSGDMKYDDNCDVVKVWNKSNYPRCACIVSKEDRDLLYERKESKTFELTIEDIAKKFGVEPENIRIKKED